VSVSGPSFRMTSMALTEYTSHVAAAAAAISRALGHPTAQAMVG
jgi:DNA-binding IclR family transcriptional regulator